jgi:hypothetical protein
MRKRSMSFDMAGRAQPRAQRDAPCRFHAQRDALIIRVSCRGCADGFRHTLFGIPPGTCGTRRRSFGLGIYDRPARMVPSSLDPSVLPRPADRPFAARREQEADNAEASYSTAQGRQAIHPSGWQGPVHEQTGERWTLARRRPQVQRQDPGQEGRGRPRRPLASLTFTEICHAYFLFPYPKRPRRRGHAPSHS